MCGNEFADECAKVGAASDAFDLVRAKTFASACNEVKEAMVPLGRFAQGVQCDFPSVPQEWPHVEVIRSADRLAGEVGPSAARTKSVQPTVVNPHQVTWSSSARVLRCAVCLNEEVTLKAKAELLVAECPGSLYARALEVCGKGHRLVWSKPLVWCSICRSHSQKKLQI